MLRTAFTTLGKTAKTKGESEMCQISHFDSLTMYFLYGCSLKVSMEIPKTVIL